jgi:hypothetical protein
VKTRHRSRDVKYSPKQMPKGAIKLRNTSQSGALLEFYSSVDARDGVFTRPGWFADIRTRFLRELSGSSRIAGSRSAKSVLQRRRYRGAVPRQVNSVWLRLLEPPQNWYRFRVHRGPYVGNAVQFAVRGHTVRSHPRITAKLGWQREQSWTPVSVHGELRVLLARTPLIKSALS